MVRAVFESLRVLLGILTFKKLSQYRVSSRNLVLGGGGGGTSWRGKTQFLISAFLVMCH